MADVLFDVLPARHRVPHAGTGQTLHVLHDHKRLLLQGDNGQVVVVQLGVTEGVEAWPHRVLQSQAAIVQFAHLWGDRRGGGAGTRGTVQTVTPGYVTKHPTGIQTETAASTVTYIVVLCR